MLNFRHAEKADSQLIYEWNTDELTRANSFNSEFFSFESHDKWFASKLNNPDYVFLIFLDKNNDPVGLVRFDKLNGAWYIGITVAKSARGKGYASRMITLATEFHYRKYKQAIFAQIKNNNIASLKVFKKAGYRFDKEMQIKNVPSSQYIYENS